MRNGEKLVRLSIKKNVRTYRDILYKQIVFLKLVFQYVIYLMDEGVIFTTAKIVEIPKSWPSKPLLFFARVDGLIKDNLSLKNWAAKVSFGP